MQRVHNWDVMLAIYAQSILGRPYHWGSMDCGTMVRGAMLTMYGGDIFPGILNWNSATDALRTIAEHGTVRDVLIKRGAENILAPFATTGDVLVLPGDHTPFDESVLLVVGIKALSADPADGIIQVPLADVLAHEEVAAYRMPFSLE